MPRREILDPYGAKKFLRNFLFEILLLGMAKAIGIYRELELQGKPEKDQRILNLTADELRKRGFKVLLKEPKDFSEVENADSRTKLFGEGVNLIFTMARGKEINEILAEREKQNIFVINLPKSIRFSLAKRGMIYQKMKALGGNVPETKVVRTRDIKFSDLKGKSILKPSNRHEFWFVVDPVRNSISSGVENENDFEKAIREYKNQNIEEIIIQKFIDGKHIKYYVIGEEVILPKNTEKQVSLKVIQQMKKEALLTGQITGLKIFGGDFMVKENMAFCVDANDWPSMGSIEGFTQEEAAIKIANLIEKEYVHGRS